MSNAQVSKKNRIPNPQNTFPKSQNPAANPQSFNMEQQNQLNTYSKQMNTFGGNMYPQIISNPPANPENNISPKNQAPAFNYQSSNIKHLQQSKYLSSQQIKSKPIIHPQIDPCKVITFLIFATLFIVLIAIKYKQCKNNQDNKDCTYKSSSYYYSTQVCIQQDCTKELVGTIGYSSAVFVYLVINFIIYCMGNIQHLSCQSIFLFVPSSKGCCQSCCIPFLITIFLSPIIILIAIILFIIYLCNYCQARNKSVQTVYYPNSSRNLRY